MMMRMNMKTKTTRMTMKRRYSRLMRSEREAIIIISKRGIKSLMRFIKGLVRMYLEMIMI